MLAAILGVAAGAGSRHVECGIALWHRGLALPVPPPIFWGLTEQDGPPRAESPPFFFFFFLFFYFKA